MLLQPSLGMMEYMKNKVNRVSALGLLKTGGDFKRGCEIISAKCPDKHPSLPNTDLYKIRLYLIGHAFELIFKSVLLKYGLSIGALKSQYGHDISKLADDVESKKFFYLSENDKALLKLLNYYYKDKDFEYFTTGSKTYPLVTKLIELSNRLYETAEGVLRKK